MKRMIAIAFGSLLLGGGLAGAQQQQQPSGGAATAPASTCPCGMMGQRGQGAACGHMRQQADVRMERTANGAVLRMTAKSPQQVAAVQAHAQQMAACMGGAPTR